MFKEAFNTDKSSLEKRQTRYDWPANFLILVEDNLHQPGPGGAFTAGKMMAFGRGAIMEVVLNTIVLNTLSTQTHLNSLHYGLSNVIIRDQKFAKVCKNKTLLLAHF